jgi:hypothetical protein
MADTTDTKMSQAEAAYQDHPKAQERCDGCTMFRDPDACTSVEGHIAPEGWCRIFKPK